MKIKTLEITGIARIKNQLNLEFNDGMNIICGINGTCKTTILECIAHLFANDNSGTLKKNTLATIGKLVATTDQPDKNQTLKYDIKKFSPTEHDSDFTSKDNAEQILYFKTTRNFNFIPLDSIPKDHKRDNYQCSKINDTGISFQDFKGWFVNRYLYSYVPEKGLNNTQKTNLEMAKKCFNILDKSIKFSHVETGSNDIMVNSQQGEIYFEYLSAGYKSCLYILLGIIRPVRELEKRGKICYTVAG